MQNKEHLRAMEKTWVHSVAGKQNFGGVSAFYFSWLESTCSTRESSASDSLLRALTQQGKRCTQILALNIYEGIRSLPPGIPLVLSSGSCGSFLYFLQKSLFLAFLVNCTIFLFCMTIQTFDKYE